MFEAVLAPKVLFGFSVKHYTKIKVKMFFKRFLYFHSKALGSVRKCNFATALHEVSLNLFLYHAKGFFFNQIC